MIHIHTVRVAKYLYNKFFNSYQRKISKKKIKNPLLLVISPDKSLTYDTLVRYINRAYRELKELGNFDYDREYVWIKYRRLDLGNLNNNPELFNSFFKMFIEEVIARGLPDVNVSYIIKKFDVPNLFFLNITSLNDIFHHAMTKRLISIGQLTGNTINLHRESINNEFGIIIPSSSDDLNKKIGIEKIYLK